MAWERVAPARGSRVGDLAKVRMSIESREASQRAGGLAVRVFIAADIGRQLAWKAKARVVIDINRASKLWRISLAAPKDEKASFSLMGAGQYRAENAPEITTLSLRLSLSTLGVRGPRERTKPVDVEHRIDGRALILEAPAWAWEDWAPAAQEAPPARSAPAAVAPLPPPPPPPASPPPDELPPAAVVPRARWPRVAPKPDPLPTDAEVREAEQMLRAGKTGREIADWFGWPAHWSAHYAEAFRLLSAQQRAA